MRRKFITLLAALPLALGAGPAFAQSTGKQAVVIQVSDGDPKTWNQALNVIGNIQAEYGKDKVDIEVVVFGNGVGLLQFDSPLANRIEDTLGRGAKVLMCENTMAGRKLTKADMLPNIGYVKAGVVEIIEKQKQGSAVVRP
jgi:intracellular sulfur oxidation DsrE/DsrF family protein